MTPEERERMNILCAGIQEERNYDNYVAMMRELSELFMRKEQRRFQSEPRVTRQHSRPYKTVSAVVNKLLQPDSSHQPEKVEIAIGAADPLFREVRLENRFTSPQGEIVSLKQGAQVDVTFEAEIRDTIELQSPAV
jgi:hypothetical protein